MHEQLPEQHHEEERQERIAVWAGCLASYNAGMLHGEWLNADVEPDELWDGIKHVLQTSPAPDAEEHFFADNEGFHPIRVGEYDSVERVTALARFLRAHGKAFAHWYNNDTSIELDEAEEAFEEAYIGEFDSEDELSEHLFEEHGLAEFVERAHKVLPDWAHVYFDFDIEMWARDLQYNGDMFTVEDAGRIFAYWSR